MLLYQSEVLDWSETMTKDVNTKFPDKVWMVDETFSTLHFWIYNYELDCHLIMPDYEEMMDDNLILMYNCCYMNS